MDERNYSETDSQIDGRGWQEENIRSQTGVQQADNETVWTAEDRGQVLI